MLSVTPLAFPPAPPSTSATTMTRPSLDIDALSGILGSISIACWVVVFTPQIVENFRRSSADGLSLLFVIIWLAGDVFNILGAVLQGVLPTMTILAVYYTVADIVLLGQCVWYRGWRLGDKEVVKAHPAAGDEEAVADEEEEATEESPLLASGGAPATRPRISDADRPSRNSVSSINSRLSNSVDATHLSPATPFLPPSKPTATPPAAETLKPRSALWAFAFNITALIVVCLAGVLGWWLSSRTSFGPDSEDDSNLPREPHHHHHHHHNHDYSSSSSSSTHPLPNPPPLHFDLWGQIFGYLCALLYLGSRIPQLLLNHRRKSTSGVSLLFFLFACVGNLTYVLSIFAYEPRCARVEGALGFRDGNGGGGGEQGTQRGGCGGGEWGVEYGRYVLVNASWLVGSAGTLVLDLCIFVQFWVYRGAVAA